MAAVNPSTNLQERLTRRIAHELRGPLNAIQLSARLVMMRDGIDPEDLRSLTTILQNVQRAAAVIDEFAVPTPILQDEVGGGAPRGIEPGLRVLVIEDADEDRARLERALAGAGDGRPEVLTAARVEQAEALLAARGADVVILDLNLPDSAGLDTVRRVCAMARRAAIVVLTGTDDDAVARSALRAGAQDYIVKGQVDRGLLLRAIAYARERKLAQEERELLIAELNEALATVKRLSGIVPICAHCKAVRVGEREEWQPIEQFVHAHSEADFSHGLCPACAARLYPGAFGT